MRTMALSSKQEHKSGRKPGGKPATSQGAPQKGSLGDYLRGVKTEWHKINWPTSIQVWQLTGVVLVMCTIITLGIWGVDNVFRFAIDWITPS